MFLEGCTDPLAPSWEPLLLAKKKLQIPWQLLGVWPGAEPLPGLHEISHLHPAPPWHPLHKEPVLDVSLHYVIFSSDGTLLHLRVNLPPQNLLRQEHHHPQYPLLDPDPCRSREYKDNFTVWRAPRTCKLLKTNLKSPVTQQALVPSWYCSLAKQPFCEFPATSGITNSS